jgi:hypothetical protein
MRKIWIRSALAATAAATLIAGVTVASAQPMGGGGGQGVHQRSAGGGGAGGGRTGGSVSGGSHGGHVGSFSQSHGSSPSFSRGGGQGVAAQHTMRSEHLGARSRTGMQTGALRSERGRTLAEHRVSRGQTFADQRHPRGQNLHAQNLRTAHGQNLRTTSRTKTGLTNTQTKNTQTNKHAFAQAGTRSHSVSLTSQQRTRISKVVLQRGFISRLRVTNVNFFIRVGVFVPRSFHLFIIPEDVVFIAPQFRGFRCFVFEDELVIVDPFTFEIIAIIPV